MHVGSGQRLRVFHVKLEILVSSYNLPIYAIREVSCIRLPPGGTLAGLAASP
jgi:hypothetical protein